MSLPKKERIHWPDNVCFFLTSSTFLHYPYFKTVDQKMIVLNKIRELKQVLRIPILAYSIAINHFHLNKEFWQSTKTLFIKDKEASWRITGYIIGNLLKHKEVSTFQELKENPFSSYKYTAEKLGNETARELVYSTIRIEEDAEGRVNIKGLSDAEGSRV